MKDILVHINVSKHCRERMAVAAKLAKTFDTHLTGVFTSALSDVAFFTMEDVDTEAVSTHEAWWFQMRDKAKAEFDAFWRDTGIMADWTEIEDDVPATLAYRAHYTDLAIVSQLDPDELLPRPEYEIPERIALHSGRPALVIPYGRNFGTVGRRILIAWNGSAQAARAVGDALPFLRKADRVTVLTVAPDLVRRGEDDQPGPAIAAHLARHGVRAETMEVETGDAEDLILSQAADMGADLVVTGAYGHPRAREIVLGGVTRALFKRMTFPVLMSH